MAKTIKVKSPTPFRKVNVAGYWRVKFDEKGFAQIPEEFAATLNPELYKYKLSAKDTKPKATATTKKASKTK